MVRVRVVLIREVARYRVAVRAQCIGRAPEGVEGQNLGCRAEVASPVDPEALFVRDLAAIAGLIDREAS